MQLLVILGMSCTVLVTLLRICCIACCAWNSYFMRFSSVWLRCQLHQILEKLRVAFAWWRNSQLLDLVAREVPLFGLLLHVAKFTRFA